MGVARGHDKTGRSTSKRLNAKRLALETPFVGLSRRLLSSPAYRLLGITARRILDRLMLEHMDHRSLENGRLIVTYDQLVQWGCSRSLIKAGFEELTAHGLVEVTDVGGIGLGTKRPSRYRLTFLPADGQPPTDEWARYTVDQIEARAEQRRALIVKRRRLREGFRTERERLAPRG